MTRTLCPALGFALPLTPLLPLLLFGVALHAATPAARAAEIRVDCAKPLGAVRPLHGGNGGPVAAGGTVDVSAHFRELGIPLTRLHDCHWPDPNVVDIHAVFPNPNPDADPADPASYDFARTDEYLRTVVATGSRVVYRLGESIEHTTTKYRVHPPRDADRWAAACRGIIRHYNEGWAGGARHGIEYWEIWNEPENRPAMWTGTDDDFLHLYAVAAKAIKTEFPRLKVGGPSLGHSGRLVGGRFEPSAFLLKFLAHCRDERLPLDFFSWHLYTDDPAECVVRARALRRLLDAHGFTRTESHLNEWNYLPANDWSPLAPANQGAPRERFYEKMTGPAAAAFAAAVLANLQDAPVDAANFFRADAGDFGLFSAHGTPRKPFFAFRAFRMLLDTPRRAEARVAIAAAAADDDDDDGDSAAAAGLVACAGVDDARTTVQVLVSNHASPAKAVRLTFANLPWSGPTRCDVSVLDATRDLVPAGPYGDLPAGAAAGLDLDLPAPAVCVVRLTKR